MGFRWRPVSAAAHRRAAQGHVNDFPVGAGVDAARTFADGNGGGDFKFRAADDGDGAGLFVGDKNLIITGARRRGGKNRASDGAG